MSSSRIPPSFSFLVSLALTLPRLFVAQNSPEDYVDAHNCARSQVGVGPIAWDDAVASYAKEYARIHASDCTTLRHSQAPDGPYGENIAWASPDLTGTDAVDLWVAEESDYDYKSNSCASGKLCGHYTQAVWRDSARLGCARVTCATGGTLVTCNYDPRGNIVGQKPY